MDFTMFGSGHEWGEYPIGEWKILVLCCGV
jgi:hypothetical protein